MDEERIPGERDPGTAMPSRPGIIGGTGYGENIPEGTGIPGVSPGKGMGDTRDEAEITDRRDLVPRLGPDPVAHPGERAPDEETPGSATGTIGGGGRDSHNSSPVRATGVDDPSVEQETRGGKD